MITNRVADRKRAQAEAKAEYEKNPVLCRSGSCGKPLSYGQFIGGHKYCSAICGKEYVTSLKVGKPHVTQRYSKVPRLLDTATWEGRVIRLHVETNPHFD